MDNCVYFSPNVEIGYLFKRNSGGFFKNEGMIMAKLGYSSPLINFINFINFISAFVAWAIQKPRFVFFASPRSQEKKSPIFFIGYVGRLQ